MVKACKDCKAPVDLEADPGAEVEVGNMRSMNWIEIVCAPCRLKRYEREEAEDIQRGIAEDEAERRWAEQGERDV